MKTAAGLMITAFVISFVMISMKDKIAGFVMNTDKTVLSQVEMDQEGVRYKIIKVQMMSGLGVELYKFIDDELVFLDSHTLTDKKDAFYKFDEGKHNLFLKDLDGDGNVEIILPSLDKNLRARLNVFNFDKVSERLIKVSKH